MEKRVGKGLSIGSNRTFMELKYPSAKIAANIGHVLIVPLWN